MTQRKLHYNWDSRRRVNSSQWVGYSMSTHWKIDVQPPEPKHRPYKDTNYPHFIKRNHFFSKFYVLSPLKHVGLVFPVALAIALITYLMHLKENLRITTYAFVEKAYSGTLMNTWLHSECIIHTAITSCYFVQTEIIHATVQNDSSKVIIRRSQDLWRCCSSGFWRRLGSSVDANVSENILSPSSGLKTSLHSAKTQKNIIIFLTAVKTWNLASLDLVQILLSWMQVSSHLSPERKLG
jgi:hypothetical protein